MRIPPSTRWRGEGRGEGHPLVPDSRLFPRLSVRIYHLAGLVFLGRQDNDGLGLLELIEVGTFDAVILHPDRAAFGPLAVRPKSDVADDRLEAVSVHVLRELVVVEAFGRLDRVAQDLQF